MKVNKKAVVSTAAVLGVAALIAGGTIAYFTDNDHAENHFTVGNVDITLYESQLHRVNSNVKPQYSETTNASPVNPNNYHACLNGNTYCTPNIAVGTDLSDVSAWQNGHVRAQNVAGQTGSGQAGVFSDEQIISDSESTAEATATASGGYQDYVADEYNNIVPGKDIRKFAYIKNTGVNSAYVRMKVTIPAEVVNYIDVKAPHTPQETSTTAGNTNINGDAMNYAYVTETEENTASGDRVMTFVFTDALKPEEMTYWSPISKVTLKKDLKESDITNINTLRTTGFGVTVDAQAVQADGFATAAAAFAAFDGQSGSDTEVDQ